MLVFKVHFGIRCRLQPLLRDLGYDILDKYEKIDFMSLTEADQKGMLDVIPAPLLYESFHLIFPNGEAKSGSEVLL